MKDGKPRLTRLTAILTRLQSKRLLTARALAEEHGVSLRTIYRDIKTLEQSGVPIFTEEGKGYSLLEDYRLPPVMFTEAEANALITAEQLIANDKDQSLIKAYQTAITKIRAVMRKEDQDKSHRLADRLHVRENPQEGSNSDYLMPLQSALTNHRVIRISYVIPGGDNHERILEPFAIYQTKGNWLLIAHCRLRDAFRTFRLDRITKITVTLEVFLPHPMSLEEYFYQCRLSWLPTLDISLSSDNYIFVPSPNKEMMEQVTIAPFQLIGITVRTNNHGSAAQDIGGLWERFMGEQIADKIPSKASNEVYSVYAEYESDVDGPYTTVLGCKVNSLDQIPEGMHGFSFPGGSYQKFTCKGDLTKGAVYGAWADIWKKDLERSYVADFEIYGAKAMNPVEAEVDIFVGFRQVAATGFTRG